MEQAASFGDEGWHGASASTRDSRRPAEKRFSRLVVWRVQVLPTKEERREEDQHETVALGLEKGEERQQNWNSTCRRHRESPGEKSYLEKGRTGG